MNLVSLTKMLALVKERTMRIDGRLIMPAISHAGHAAKLASSALM